VGLLLRQKASVTVHSEEGGSAATTNKRESHDALLTPTPTTEEGHADLQAQ
jgi:hypothetical protein